MAQGPLNRRFTNIPVAHQTSGLMYQIYIIHTTEEYNRANTAGVLGGPYPTHAICFRTLDPTTSPFGGAKLGIL